MRAHDENKSRRAPGSYRGAARVSKANKTDTIVIAGETQAAGAIRARDGGGAKGSECLR